jgi:hypothetical protein
VPQLLLGVVDYIGLAPVAVREVGFISAFISPSTVTAFGVTVRTIRFLLTDNLSSFLVLLPWLVPTLGRCGCCWGIVDYIRPTAPLPLQ